jgi:hypothetical protein
MAFFGAGTRSSPIAFVDSEDELYKYSKHSSSSSLSVTLEKPPEPELKVMIESACQSYLTYNSFFQILLSKATNLNPNSGTENGNALIVSSVRMARWLALVHLVEIIRLWKIAFLNLKARKQEKEDGELNDKLWKILVSKISTMVLTHLPPGAPSFLFGLGRLTRRCLVATSLYIILTLFHSCSSGCSLVSHHPSLHLHLDLKLTI